MRSLHPGRASCSTRRARWPRRSPRTRAPVSVALARRLMWSMLGAEHPMEAHRADSRAMFARGQSADAARRHHVVPREAPGELPRSRQRRPAGHLSRPQGGGVLMGTISDRIAELGLELPEMFAAPPGVKLSFDPLRISGDHAYVSGHGPLDGTSVLVEGKVGAEVSQEQGYEAARMTALSMIRTLENELGDLDRVVSWVKVLGLVNCAPRLQRHPGGNQWIQRPRRRSVGRRRPSRPLRDRRGRASVQHAGGGRGDPRSSLRRHECQRPTTSRRTRSTSRGTPARAGDRRSSPATRWSCTRATSATTRSRRLHASAHRALDWDRVYPLAGPIAVDGRRARRHAGGRGARPAHAGLGLDGDPPRAGPAARRLPGRLPAHLRPLRGDVTCCATTSPIPLEPFLGTMGVCHAGASRWP